MKRILKAILISMSVTALISGCSNSVDDTENTNATESVTQTQQTETQTDKAQIDTEDIIDINDAFARKPYSNGFALERVDQLQSISDEQLYSLCSIDESPIFYDGFFYENNVYNVTLDFYEYDMDNENIRKYFDIYEYSKFASVGALRVVDSFVHEDTASGKFFYYCYYTTTRWSEDESLDTMDFYRDVITVNKADKSIEITERVAIRTQLEVPKEITGDHDFHGVI